MNMVLFRLLVLDKQAFFFFFSFVIVYLSVCRLKRGLAQKCARVFCCPLKISVCFFVFFVFVFFLNIFVSGSCTCTHFELRLKSTTCVRREMILKVTPHLG